MGYLYGLKSSALALCNNFSEVLGNYTGFTALLANPGVWFKASMDKYSNQYYAYILVYVVDILVVDKYPRKFMSVLFNKYTVNPSIKRDPKIYL